jgi:periplasmic copper chaperone A
MRSLPSCLFALVLVSSTLAGCAPRDHAPGPAPATELAISDPWARPSPAGVTVGAAYLTIVSPAADRLLAAAVPAGVAERVELHEVVTDSLGQMGMQPVEAIELPAGQPVELRPGAHHIMMMGLSKPLVAGDTLELRLRFERAGERAVRVPVGAR